jgi:diguanylate cyclase (GGDEF)-like protein
VTDLAYTDSVTGLPNRRALDERLQDELRYAKQMTSMLSVVMMDLDGFKSVNDVYGHVVGDEVLRSLFNYLAENMRATDFLARYGGDELTLVMRDAGVAAAKAVALKILELMKEYKFEFPGKTTIQLGISAGIAVYPIHSRSAGDLLRSADMALYQAKKQNRGSYIVANGATGQLSPLMLSSD